MWRFISLNAFMWVDQNTLKACSFTHNEYFSYQKASILTARQMQQSWKNSYVLPNLASYFNIPLRENIKQNELYTCKIALRSSGPPIFHSIMKLKQNSLMVKYLILSNRRWNISFFIDSLFYNENFESF